MTDRTPMEKLAGIKLELLTLRSRSSQLYRDNIQTCIQWCRDLEEHLTIINHDDVPVIDIDSKRGRVTFTHDGNNHYDEDFTFDEHGDYVQFCDYKELHEELQRIKTS